MAHLHKKTKNGNTYYYVREIARVNGKPKVVNQVYLGTAEKIMAVAEKIRASLHGLGIGRILLETSGNVGKAYRKNDEIGTPLCVTVDFETIEKEPMTVTVRDRDSMAQIRIPAAELNFYVSNFFKIE